MEECAYAGCHRAGVYVPILAERSGGKLIEVPGLFDEREKANFHELGEDAYRSVEGSRTVMSLVRSPVESTSWNDIVDVRVVAEVAATGVKHAEEARRIAGGVGGSRSKLRENLRRSTEERLTASTQSA